MKLKDTAARISDHLARFEASPIINVRTGGPMGRSRFYHARAWVAGNRVAVCYVSYQGWQTMDRARAEQYLRWLDAGHVGRHWDADRDAAGKEKP